MRTLRLRPVPHRPLSACAGRPLPRAGSPRFLRADPDGRRRSLGVVYDHDPDDVAVLGWEEFILRQWESLFTGYRSWAGLRTQGRRWSDLIEAGLGCSQDVADGLVSAAVINGPDRRLEGADAVAVVSGMTGVLADIPAALTGMAGLEPAAIAMLLERHARLLSFIHAQALGPDNSGIAGL